jgi:hypothetical protein
MSYKGFFKPKNPNRYKGDPTNIVYRSSWELKLMSYLDVHPDIIEWSSEEFCIPYVSPIDRRIHRYFPDFYLKKKNIEGKIETVVIEVKPKNQVVPPTVVKTKTNKPTKRYVREVMTYGVNEAKWKAAQAFCEDRKWKFMIMTESELGIK